MTDEEGIALLVADTPGRVLRCEPRLALAGARCKLTASQPPRDAFANAASLAMVAAVGAHAPPSTARRGLIEAAYLFARARPWLGWKGTWRADGNLRIRVEGPSDVFPHIFVVAGAAEDDARGFYLVRDEPTADRFIDLMERGSHDDLAFLPGIHVLFNRQPLWAAELMDAAAGGKSLIPWPFRTTLDGLAACNELDTRMLAATALAFAKLKPKAQQASVRLDGPNGAVVATLARDQHP